MSYIDLHIHSNYSDDGEFEPKEIIEFCLEKGIRYFAIADHNSVKSIAETKKYCENKNIDVVSAVELDCNFNGVNLHVLGYGIDYNSPIFNEIEENIIFQEQGASIKRVELVRSLGIEVSDETIALLSKNGVINGEMIAEAAMKFDKNKENNLLKPYYDGGSRSDNPYVNFYWDFCAQGKPAYVEVKFMSLCEAIKIILDTGGIPILAHPGNNIKENMELLEDIISMGVEGIEVYSSYHNEKQTLIYENFAKNNNLIMTCGSDFHGKNKPSISIGSVNCVGSEEEIIKKLKERVK